MTIIALDRAATGTGKFLGTGVFQFYSTNILGFSAYRLETLIQVFSIPVIKQAAYKQRDVILLSS
jgi:hypothetical protein